MPTIKKFAKEKSNQVRRIMNARPGDDKSIVDKLLGDISKSSATKQLIVGTSSGWLTGYVFMKVGKVVAVAIGGGIILLQVANENGYVKINWSKVNKNLDKVADKVEEKITGEGPSWTDKVERFVDRKVDQAENIVKKKQKSAKKWYDVNFDGENSFRMKESYIFYASFVAGLCFGFATS